MYEEDNYTQVEINDAARAAQEAQRAEQERIKRAYKAAKKEKRKKTIAKIAIGAGIGIAFGIMAGCTFQIVNRVAEYVFPSKQKAAIEQPKEEPKVEIPKSSVVKPEESPASSTGRSTGIDVSDIVESAMPTVVSITNKSVQQVRSMFGLGVQEYESTAVGSGIIIGQNDEELLIVTNNHVVERANALTVGFIDDEIYEAYVKGAEAERDLAVIAVKLSSISEDTMAQIRTAQMGDSDELRVGEQVVAIGNALGYGQSVTTGIVSALNRKVTIEDITNDLIQTDAAINPGNSGGALLNMRGELIGINSAKFASATIEGIGYAIPIDTVKPIVEELMNRETRELLEEKDAGYLGITGLNVDASVSAAYGIPKGVYLQEVAEDSPAAKAGLIKGDVIKKFDGTSVDTIAELKEMLLYYAVGEEVEVVYYRSVDGEYVENTVTVVLGDRKNTALDPDRKETDSSQQEDDIEDEFDIVEEPEERGQYDDNSIYYDFDSIFDSIFGR